LAGYGYDGTTELKDGTAEMRTETDGLDDEISDKIDEMIESITGGNGEVVSFVSEKNTNVKAVQFVIQTEEIEIAEAEADTGAVKEELTFWQKILRLFGLY
jgi:putative membrane protein